MIIEGNEKEKAAMAEFHKGNRKEGLRLQEEFAAAFPNCMRELINKKLKGLSELTEHTIAYEIEPPKEILRKEAQ